MLNDLQTIFPIGYEFPLRQIMGRLGGKMDDSEHCRLVETTGRLIYSECGAQGVYGTMRIACKDADGVTLVDGTRIDSEAVARMLHDADGILIFAATLGGHSTEMCRQALAEGDGARALILDAAASECVEAAIHSLQRMLRRQWFRNGVCVDTPRFSCGYGGWSLDAQKNFFGWLELEKLGLHLTEGGLIEPEKTITAIARINYIR